MARHIPESLRTWATDGRVTATALNDDVYRSLQLLYSPPTAGAWLSADWSLPTTATQIPLDRVLWDSDNMFDPETGLFTINTPGVYEASLFLRLSKTGLDDEFHTSLWKNGTFFGSWYAKMYPTGSGGTTIDSYAHGVYQVRCSVGDTLGMVGWQSMGTEHTVKGYDSLSYYGIRTHMSILWSGVDPTTTF